jgi:hypothetical protein
VNDFSSARVKLTFLDGPNWTVLSPRANPYANRRPAEFSPQDMAH